MARCLQVVTAGRVGGGPAVGLTLGGAGSGIPLWLEVLTAITALPAARRRSGEAASAGAALLAAKACDLPLSLESLDPLEAEIEPDPTTVAAYRALQPAVERVTATLLEIGVGNGPGPAAEEPMSGAV